MNLEDLIQTYEEELIIGIASSVKGIGLAKAGAISAYFEFYISFMEANHKDFEGILNKNKKPVLSEQIIKSIIKERDTIPTGLDVRQAWRYKLTKDFISSQINTVRSINLDNIDINPLLIEALDLKEPKEILSFVLYQHVTRSVVTAWGTCVENMVKYAGSEAVARNHQLVGKNFDLKKSLDGIDFYLQIKSGPNTMNVGMVHSLNETIAKLSEENKALLGMTYGKRERISNQIMGNLKDPDNQTKVGRELWDFVSEETDYYKIVINDISDASGGIFEENFIQLINNKIDDLVKQWNIKYEGMTKLQILEYYI